jgi:O-acetyl-ADP-ribose deacetylase (regulator of RNase III)
MDAVFRIAREQTIRTIAIPAVGTGIAGFPIDECAAIMAGCLMHAFDSAWQPDEVRFVLFGTTALEQFQKHFEAAFKT